MSLPISINIDNSKTQITDGKPAVRRYWPVPPTTPAPFEYINVNHDVNLRKDVTLFFHKKVLKWLDTDKNFSKHKNKKNLLNSVDGQIHIYNLLRYFVKRSNINWYDLRDNYYIIKEFLNNKL